MAADRQTSRSMINYGTDRSTQAGVAMKRFGMRGKGARMSMGASMRQKLLATKSSPKAEPPIPLQLLSKVNIVALILFIIYKFSRKNLAPLMSHRQ